MTAPFRALDDPAATVEIQLDGAPARFDPARSILANLLLRGDAPFFCAIGHCQACLVTVDGAPVLACRTYPRAGARITLPNSLAAAGG